jgi:hypothetical protein
MRVLLTTFAATAALFAAPEAAASDWNGTYVYEEYAGRTAGGSPIQVTWTLKIAPGHCSLRAEGYQTDEDYRCGTTANARTLAVRWISHADGSLKNAHGIALYRPQQQLFTLTRMGGDLRTRWGGLRTNKERKSTAAAFRKV